MLSPINGTIIQSILGVHASRGDFGVIWSILDDFAQFGAISMSILGKCQRCAGRATIPRPCLVKSGQSWAVWDDFNVNSGQVTVLFREGDNRI